jgi:hypothetical protein
METEGSRKGLFMADNRKTLPEGECGHSEHLGDLFIRILATGALKGRGRGPNLGNSKLLRKGGDSSLGSILCRVW